ncbi:BRO family protein [Mannheimia haemolytica]|uniref:BRO family protein n=1 Tax=Mannheimia haemolytica TaxID=75985 RepID=UPI000588BF2B|nr:BRO family protein [Mannheimia haemolytica]AJE08376.1 transporter [Mannheimia haemolytica USDA-ARS-USMARC-184]KYL11594.1 transporter [Mannheimia haemolytica]UFK42270.1 ORF6C domain-containing protein [Mannheimia haemolytica]UQX61983.1 ORF6C domain-containing protein [Mannheimia haemolytica]HDL1112359.1 ORF6C domain-containing protein [Mannheimia haemolytica]
MTTLTFQNTTLSVINQRNQTFVSSKDLGLALAYKNPTSDIMRIYDRNADEFTPEMTALIEMQTNGGKQQVRIFSLRGAHLIAMFARTKVAKDFRKWVLDILDKEVLQNNQQIAPLAEPTITAEEQNMLQNAVKATHERTKLSYGEIWARTKNKFRVAEYKQIKRSDLRDALIYVASMQPDFLTQPKQTINVDWFNMMNFALLLKQYHRFTKDLPHIHTYLSALPEHSAMAGLLKNHLTEMKNNDRLFTDSILSLSEISNHFLPQDQWKSLMRIFSEMIVE